MSIAVENMTRKPQAGGLASILAIGTANPEHCVYQNDYPDYYFRLTRSEHLTELKQKFTRICKYLYRFSRNLPLSSDTINMYIIL